MKTIANHCQSNGKHCATICSVNGFCNTFHCSFKGLQWFFIVFQWFCNGFHCSPHCFCNGFVAFSLVFPMFSLPFPWFAIVFMVFSMVLLWSSLIFNDFAMVFTALSSVSNGFPCFSIKSYENQHSADFSMGGRFPGNFPPHRKVTRVMVFNCFFNDFAMVSIAFIGFQWFSLLFN